MVRTRSGRRYQRCINAVLTIVSFTMIFPLVLLFMSSISSERSLIVNGYSVFPQEFSLDAYRYILSNARTIFQAYGITILVTVVGTIINLLMSSMAAFSLSVKALPFRRIISFYVLFTMLFSGGLVPSYLMWTGVFHIKNTIWALIIPNYMMSAMNIMLIRTYYMSSIPEAIYEAAKIDGASYFLIFRTIVIPLGRPIMVTMTVFAGLTYWNDWTNGLYYINDAKLYSIQTLLNKMIQEIQALQANAAASAAAMAIPQVSVRMGIAFVALLPILIMFPFLQKYFSEGIAMGAVKG